MLKRHPDNPVLAANDVPYDASLIFNAGVTKYNGKYVMVFRNDYGAKDKATWLAGERFETNLGFASSDDGVKWNVHPSPVWQVKNDEIRRVYDPRLTVIDGRCTICFAMDTAHGIRGGVGVTEDFQSFEILSLSSPDNRNMVLFPEKINGKFCRFERPFPMYMRPGERFDMWFADSPDLKYWGNQQLVLGTEQVQYCSGKVGPGAPPIKTDRGWLALFHAVVQDKDRPLQGWEAHGWTKLYHAGLLLLDADEPWKIKGMSPQPVLAPDEQYAYEIDGFRGSVIFPGGMILEDDGEAKVYYGGADTVECLATAHVDELLAMIEPLPG